MRIDINFSPREHVYARKAYLVLALLVLAAAAAFVLGYGRYAGARAEAGRAEEKVVALEARQAELGRGLAELRKKVDPERVKSDAQQIAFVNAAIRQRSFSWTAFLNTMEGLVPEGVGITALRPNFDSLVVEITGNAEDMGRILKFMDNLTKSRSFEDIPPSFHTSEVTADKDIHKTIQQFNLKIRYYPEGRPDGGAAGGGR